MSREQVGVGVALDLGRRLSEGEVVILDGGIGTELQARGVPMDDGIWCGAANFDHADAVQSMHEAYLNAGAEVILTNTFATNRAALESSGLGSRVAEANRKAVEAALRAREAVGERPIAIGGSMSPFCALTMRMTDAGGSSPHDEIDETQYRPTLANYREQASMLADMGVDLIVLEMVNVPDYGLAAIEAATETGLPVWLGVSPCRLADGSLGTAQEVPEHVVGFEELLSALARPELAAVNVMHAKASVVEEALQVVRRYFDGPIGAYPEAGDWVPPEWVFTDVSPEEYAVAAMTWVEHGAQIVGGCCGVRPAHIEALATGLRGQARDGARTPTLEP